MRSGCFVAVGLLALAVGSAACRPFYIARSEFDSITRKQDASEPEELRYQATVERMPWSLRQLEGTGLGRLFALIFQFRPRFEAVANPAGFARERLLDMVARAGTDLAMTATATSRCLWVLEFDPSPLNKVVCIQGIERMMRRLELDPMRGLSFQGRINDPAKVSGWIDELTAAWPDRRQAKAMAPSERLRHLEVLAKLTALPLSTRAGQRALIRALETAVIEERDGSMVGPMRQALRAALGHAMTRGLLDGLASKHSDVRESSIHAWHRSGGSAAVSFVLFSIARPRSQAVLVNRYDESVAVRRALTRICGQLDAERAKISYRTGPPPVEFLCNTALEDDDQGLRLIALEALSHCLGRPPVFESSWARTWWQNYIDSVKEGM